ncbi:unnamed protein product, partial [marine sediment metagenome]
MAEIRKKKLKKENRKRLLGDIGEKIVALELMKWGYTVHKNLSDGYDILALRNGKILKIEVKMRYPWEYKNNVLVAKRRCNFSLTKNIIPKVYEKIVKCDKAFIKNVINNNKKDYSLLKFIYTPLSRKNLENDRKNVLNYFRKVNMDLKVIKYLSNISMDEYDQMKKYQAYFRDLLYSKRCSINEKLVYLKENGIDFTNWINTMLRNKFVHHLNFRFVKDDDKTCGFKIIFGKYKNLIIKTTDYYKGLCEIYALSDFLYIQLFNKSSTIE